MNVKSYDQLTPVQKTQVLVQFSNSHVNDYTYELSIDSTFVISRHPISVAKEGGVLVTNQILQLTCQPKSSVVLWCNGSIVPCVGNGPGSNPGRTANLNDQLVEATQHEVLMRHLNGGISV
jgi:hypothetical protein